MTSKTYFRNTLSLFFSIGTCLSVYLLTSTANEKSELASHGAQHRSVYWYENAVPVQRPTEASPDIRFKDVTVDSGLPQIYGLSIAIADFNNDKKPDVLAGGHLFKNVSTFTKIMFVDVTTETLPNELKGNPAWVDLNNDGLVDIVSSSGQVYLQKSQYKFVDSAADLNLILPKKSFTVSFVDLNQDGWIDVLVGMFENHTDNRFTFEKSKAYLNQKGLRFTEWDELGFQMLPAAYTRSIVWGDYNLDRKPDGYFSNYRLRPNYLLTQTKSGWHDLALLAGVTGQYKPKMYFDKQMQQNYGPSYGHTIGSAWADLNNDGLLDLWSSNLVHKFVGQGKDGYDIRGYLCDDSKIYKNLGPPLFNFKDMRALSLIPFRPMGDWSKYQGDELWAHTTTGDFDNDGLLDVYVSQVYNLKYAHSLLFKNLGNFKFQNLARGQAIEAYDGYGGAWADLNGDGLLDLLNSGRPQVDIPSQVKVFKNETYNGHNFLKVRLHPGASGKNPITTQVLVHHENGVLMRQVEGVTGSINQQNDPVLHFGLGKINQLKWIEIRWSSGRTTHIKAGLKLNATLNVSEP